MTKNEIADELEICLAKAKESQREFDNHWLWTSLKMTPKSFFERVRTQVEVLGVDKNLWEQKVREARLAIEIRSREKKGEYQKMDYAIFRGFKI